MFYAHQFLARKGPIATVWMASHLHHRVKKPQYNSVDINSAIDEIIFPNAPLSLRTYGHLLLGVVRVYSKKVEYLYHDCNDTILKVSKAFTPAEANASEAPAIAPVNEITLPEQYSLDALELDDNVFTECGADNYMRSPDDITLPDYTPINMDLYVAITFEDIDMTPIRSSFHGLGGQERDVPQPATADGTDSSGGSGAGNGTAIASEGLPGVSSSGYQPMEEDVLHVPPVDISERMDAAVVDQSRTRYTPGVFDLGPSTLQEVPTQRINERESPQSIEVMRHAILDSTLPDIPLPYQTANETEQQTADASGKEKEFVSPIAEELLESGEQPPSFQPQMEQLNAPLFEESPNLFGSHISFGQASVELAIRSTPSAPQVRVPPFEVPPRRNKRKLYNEKAIVLSNKALKDALNDTSNILRKKRPLEKLVRKDQFFTEPVSTGMCEQLHDMFMDRSEKPHHVNVDKPMHEAEIQDTPEIVLQPHVSQGVAAQQIEDEIEGDLNVPTNREAEHSPRNTSEHECSQTQLDMEIERLRRNEGDTTSTIPEFIPSHVVLLSPTRGDDMPAVSPGSFRSGQEGQSSFDPGLFPTPDLASTAETVRPEQVAVCTPEPHQIHHQSFSNVPELIKSPRTDELHFLDADTSIPGTHDVRSLSVRTRCAAQYLNNKLSPGTPSSGDDSVVFSLNDILQDQPRKRCARMFYETLVLTSFDLIKVAQNGSYGDIALRLTPALKA